jgi:hypothetical protein
VVYIRPRWEDVLPMSRVGHGSSSVRARRQFPPYLAGSRQAVEVNVSEAANSDEPSRGERWMEAGQTQPVQPRCLLS